MLFIVAVFFLDAVQSEVWTAAWFRCFIGGLAQDSIFPSLKVSAVNVFAGRKNTKSLG
jgi:hypothetical protein